MICLNPNLILWNDYLHYITWKHSLHDWCNTNSTIEKNIYTMFFFLLHFFPSHSQWKPFEFTPLFTTTRKKRICGCIYFKLCFYIFNLFLIALFSEFQNYEWDFMLSFERAILMKVNWVTFLKSKNRTLQFYSFVVVVVRSFFFSKFYNCFFKIVANRQSGFYSEDFWYIFGISNLQYKQIEEFVKVR